MRLAFLLRGWDCPSIPNSEDRIHTQSFCRIFYRIPCRWSSICTSVHPQESSFELGRFVFLISCLLNDLYKQFKEIDPTVQAISTPNRVFLHSGTNPFRLQNVDVELLNNSVEKLNMFIHIRLRYLSVIRYIIVTKLNSFSNHWYY